MKKKKSEFKIRKFFIDEKNYLQIKSNDKLIFLTLYLDGEKRGRNIGTVTKSTRTIFMKRKVDKHLFRKMNAWGFNDYVLREQSTFDFVSLSDDKGNHWSKIPVSYILENGTFLNFQKVGFELQRFVSLEQIEQFKVYNFENRRI
jgi:hypothetical protein